jgi:hypothetical protein
VHGGIRGPIHTLLLLPPGQQDHDQVSSSLKIRGVQYYDTVPSRLLVFPAHFLMAASLRSGRSPSPNKEDATSGFVPSLRGDDSEKIQLMNPKLLRRATLKIDFYLVPIVAMFCMSSLPAPSSAAWCSSLVQIFCHFW